MMNQIYEVIRLSENPGDPKGFLALCENGSLETLVRTFHKDETAFYLGELARNDLNQINLDTGDAVTTIKRNRYIYGTNDVHIPVPDYEIKEFLDGYASVPETSTPAA